MELGSPVLDDSGPWELGGEVLRAMLFVVSSLPEARSGLGSGASLSLQVGRKVPNVVRKAQSTDCLGIA